MTTVCSGRAAHKFVTVRAAIDLRMAFSFAKAISIELKSGL